MSGRRAAWQTSFGGMERGQRRGGGELAYVAVGRPAVIAFHSREDRIVKRSLRQQGGGCPCPPQLPICTCDRRARLRELSRKPLRPDEAEERANPRPRSGRWRVTLR